MNGSSALHPVDSPFEVRGVIEGFYGPYYTFPERKDLLRFMGRNGFNFYVYGPKNDRQHRMRWWDPYPPEILEQFADTLHVAQVAHVQFCYAISFGEPMDHAKPEDLESVTQKLQAFYDRGCRSFGVLLDDIVDVAAFHQQPDNFRALAGAHADVCNRLHAWAQSLPEACSFCMCPGEYSGVAPFSPYLHRLGEALYPDIDVFYTGPSISSRTITVEDVQGFATAVARKPLIWDNFPVNDLLARREMHVGPLLGRDPLLPSVTKGIVSNVMTQEEASKIALSTIAEYERQPLGYDPERAWKRALQRAGGQVNLEALTRFAENSLSSCLQDEQAPEMTRLSRQVIASLRRGERATESEAIAALARYLDSIDEACYQLKNRMRNLALREDLLPWIEALETKLWMARRAVTLLRAMDLALDHSSALRALEGALLEVEGSPKSIGGEAVMELGRYARDLAVAAAPSTVAASGGIRTARTELDHSMHGLPLSAAHHDSHDLGDPTTEVE